jgi:hypothetical protein
MGTDAVYSQFRGCTEPRAVVDHGSSTHDPMAFQLCNCRAYYPCFFGLVSNSVQKLTPIMLADITYGTFLLFGSACIIMGVYTIFFVPETKGVPLESIHVLFEGSIVRGCIQDTFPGASRAKKMMAHEHTDDDESVDGDHAKKGARVEQVERV